MEPARCPVLCGWIYNPRQSTTWTEVNQTSNGEIQEDWKNSSVGNTPGMIHRQVETEKSYIFSSAIIPNTEWSGPRKNDVDVNLQPDADLLQRLQGHALLTVLNAKQA